MEVVQDFEESDRKDTGKVQVKITSTFEPGGCVRTNVMGRAFSVTFNYRYEATSCCHQIFATRRQLPSSHERKSPISGQRLEQTMTLQ